MSVVKMSNSVNKILGREYGLENMFGFRKKKCQSSFVVQRTEERARHFLLVFSKKEVTVNM